MHRIKITFNKEFDDIHLKKVSEIGKIKEKNKRINKILNDFKISQSEFLHKSPTGISFSVKFKVK
jgi:hypothetical protein